MRGGKTQDTENTGLTDCYVFLKQLIQTRLHMSMSPCGKICITLPKRIRNERRRNYYSHCSIVVAAGAKSWRPLCVIVKEKQLCLGLQKRTQLEISG